MHESTRKMRIRTDAAMDSPSLRSNYFSWYLIIDNPFFWFCNKVVKIHKIGVAMGVDIQIVTKLQSRKPSPSRITELAKKFNNTNQHDIGTLINDGILVKKG